MYILLFPYVTSSTLLAPSLRSVHVIYPRVHNSACPAFSSFPSPPLYATNYSKKYSIGLPKKSSGFQQISLSILTLSTSDTALRRLIGGLDSFHLLIAPFFSPAADSTYRTLSPFSSQSSLILS